MTEKNTPNGNDSLTARAALRRLLVVLAAVIGILIYSYGWTVTEIDLGRPQEEQRQENVTIALRELLSPRVFQQERAVTTLSAPFLMDCDAGDVPEQPDPASGEPVLVIEPACAESGDIITLNVTNATANADGRVRWVPPAESDEEVRERPREILETGREELVINSGGDFTGTIEVPRIRGGDGEIHTVNVLVAVPAGPIQLSETAVLVIDRMAQTIFMALVATTVAIPIAAVISFFAARNLMQQVRLSVGSMLISVIGLAGGLLFGGALIGWLGRLGFSIGRGDFGGDFGALFAFVIPVAVLAGVYFGLAVLNRVMGSDDPNESNKLLQTLNTIITTLTIVFAVGALGGLGILGGEQISNLGEWVKPDSVSGVGGWLVNALGVLIVALGNLLNILATLIDLGMTVIAAVLAAFALSGILSNLFGSPLQRTPDTLNHVLGAVLGAVSGALLMALMGVFGLWASLLGLLPLIVAAILGGTVLRLIVSTVLGYADLRVEEFAGDSRTARLIRFGIFGVGAVITFVWAFGQLNVGRSLVDGTLPSQVPATLLGMTLPVTRYVFTAAVMGAVLGGIGGLLTGVKVPFPMGNVLYNVSRTSLNVVRSIEPLIMGLVFVVWVGIGPFAGVLALTLHSIAALGKLYSEQIENIDPGPIEALRSTGANQLQTVVYAVVPQIIPPYIAFTMYRWDINVRMSTIIGFVGGGGIGLLLQQQINLLRYRDAGVAVLAIAIVVSILDYASASIRERLT